MQYDFTLLANGGQVLDVRGKFFKYKSGIGAIRVRTDKGGYVDLLPGQGVWNTDYTSLVVQDKSGAANAGVLLAGDFDFHDDRITGTVDVVDGGKARTKSGIAYMVGLAVSATAGNYAAAQLWNPAGSGMNLIVEKISGSMYGSASAIVDIGKTTVQLGAVGFGIVNKNFGSASTSIALSRVQSTVPTMPAAGGQIMFGLMLNQAQPIIVPLNEPIVVTPGTGIVVQCEATGAAMFGSFEWFEESVNV